MSSVLVWIGISVSALVLAYMGVAEAWSAIRGLFRDEAPVMQRSTRVTAISHREIPMGAGLLEDLEEFSTRYRYPGAQPLRFEREVMAEKAA